MCVTHGEKNVCSKNLFQQTRICTVATDSKSSDTVWFVRLHSNHEEAMTYITDDCGHNIARVKTYICDSYYEKQKTNRNSQVYSLMNKVAYLYKDSIVCPYINSVECPNNCIEILYQDLCDIKTSIEHYGLTGL